MKISRRNTLLGAGALAATAASRAHAAGLQDLYAAAKKEGQLTWYSGILDQPLCDKVANAFTQKYPGVRVNAIKTTSQVAFQRVLQDLKAGAPQSDVLTTTDASHMVYLSGKSLLVKYVPENEAGMVKSLQNFDPDGYYVVSWVGLVALLYNTARVPAAEAPKDWPDLTDPKWKSKLAFGSPNYSGMVGVWTVAMEDRYGWELFRQAQQARPADRPFDRRCGDGAQFRRARGRRRQSGLGAAQRRQGQPARGELPDLGHAGGAVALRRSSRARAIPNAAKLFLEFLCGKEYSQILADGFEQPLRPDVPPPKGAKSLAEIKFFTVPTPTIEKELPANKGKWRDTFGGLRPARE